MGRLVLWGVLVGMPALGTPILEGVAPGVEGVPRVATADFIFIGVVSASREGDLAAQRHLLHLLSGEHARHGRFRGLRQWESQAFLLVGIGLAALGYVRGRRQVVANFRNFWRPACE